MSAKHLKFAEPLGTPPSVEFVSVNDLLVDDSYQRSTDSSASRSLISSIAAGWDWRLCTPLVVSRRTVGRYVIDGQHRLAAAKLRGDIPYLPCCIASYTDPADEARMFVAANRARRSINRLDDFHASIAAADSDALWIRAYIKQAGLSIARVTSSTAWRPGEVAFVASIASAIRKHGHEIVQTALNWIGRAFPDQVLKHGGSIFLGLVRILASPPTDFDPQRMFEVLQASTAEEWGQYVVQLKGGSTRAQFMRQAMLERYDRDRLVG